MHLKTKHVVFLQGFGCKNYFKTLVPEALWGWKRNIALLLHVLNKKGIAWSEVYSPDLRDVKLKADLFVLRDWRYRPEDIEYFRKIHPDIPVIAMTFQIPGKYLNIQMNGELRDLFDIQDDMFCETDYPETESGLFLADKVIVRSRLNQTLFMEMGFPSDKMVLLPHSPVWKFEKDEVVPYDFLANVPISFDKINESVNFLFIGEHIIRKGLIRLLRVFNEFQDRNLFLHVYNSSLFRYKNGEKEIIPRFMHEDFEKTLKSPNIIIHPLYRDIHGFVAAYEKMNVLICPSIFDLGPNSMVEACQMDIPIVATDMCGSVDDLLGYSIKIIESPRWWTQQNNNSHFSECIEKSIIDPAPYQNDLMGNHFESTISKILETWKEVLDLYC